MKAFVEESVNMLANQWSAEILNIVQIKYLNGF
jgi:hypothetical protein